MGGDDEWGFKIFSAGVMADRGSTGETWRMSVVTKGRLPTSGKRDTWELWCLLVTPERSLSTPHSTLEYLWDIVDGDGGGEHRTHLGISGEGDLMRDEVAEAVRRARSIAQKQSGNKQRRQRQKKSKLQL